MPASYVQILPDGTGKKVHAYEAVVGVNTVEIQAVVQVDVNGDPVTPAVTGLTDTQLRATPVPVSGTVTANAGTGTRAVSGTFWQATQPVSGTVTANAGTGTMAVSGTFWQATQPVSVAATVATKEIRAATPTQSSVANSVSNVTLLAANANRLGATIFNDDTAGSGATLKVKLGATASASSFTVAVAPQGYFEVPFHYTGIIDGIASAATGNARITSLEA